MDVLPPVFPSASIAGELLPVWAEKMGLRAGIPIIFGGSDQAMQALGNGVIRPGVLSSTIGTGGQLFASTESFVIDDALRLQSYCHIIPDVWHVETAILAAGLSFKWLRDQFFTKASFQDLADAAQSVPAGADGVLYTPYLLGERTPHMDPLARGCLVGLTKYHNRNHVIRAIMEGVIYALKQGLELLVDLGVQVDKVVASGGGVGHPLWLRLQADIYNRPVYKSETVEASAFGAAVLASVGAGYYTDAREAVDVTVRWENEPVIPQSEYTSQYDERYQQHTALYAALKDTFHSLSDSL
jgi:xylulokinase